MPSACVNVVLSNNAFWQTLLLCFRFFLRASFYYVFFGFWNVSCFTSFGMSSCLSRSMKSTSALAVTVKMKVFERLVFDVS
jgi:hypothetical protein